MLLKLIDTTDRWLARIMPPLVILLSLLIAFGLVAGIVSREVIGLPLLGLEEIIMISVMWLYTTGAALASRERSHLSGDFIQALTNNVLVIKVFRLLASTLSLIMAFCFVVWSFSLLTWGIDKGQSTPVFAIPLFVAQSSLFICSLLFVLYCTRDVLQDVTKLRRVNSPGHDPYGQNS